MVTKDKIIDYCCETPGNTNKMVLDSLLEDFGGSDKPTGTIEITENGSVDVARYVTADVNVSGGGGEPIETIIWVNEDPTAEFSGYVNQSFDAADYDFIRCKFIVNLSHTDYIFYSYVNLKEGYPITNLCLHGSKPNSGSKVYYRIVPVTANGTKSYFLMYGPAQAFDGSTDAQLAIPLEVSLIKY